jgi:hypothetical protein
VNPPQIKLPPRIVPNRKQLDDRFPVLGFTIFYDSPAFLEVLLATRKDLFDPANTGRRTPATFYSSRQDSRLIPIQGGTAVYLAPIAVLRGFAQGTPRPSEIYYTVIAYPDAQGTHGSFAQPPETLPASAPSVAISQHFGSDGFGDLLGMNPDKLRRFQPAVAQSWSLGVNRISPEEDRAEGEDGSTAPPPVPSPAPAQSRASTLSSYEDGYSRQGPDTPERCDPPIRVQQFAADPSYDDGYSGDPPQHADLNFAAAQQTSFRPQDSEPAVLEDGDDDDDRYSSGRYRVANGRGDGGGSDDSSYRVSRSSALARDDDDDDNPSGGSYRLVGGDGGGSGDGARFYASKSSAVFSEKDTNGGGTQERTSASRMAAATVYGDEADQWHESESGSEQHEAAYCEPAYQSLSAPALSAPVSGPATAPAAPLTIEAKRDLIGKLGEYSAVDADGAYNGVLGPEHPAYRHYHLGLSFGVGPFNQERGDLGRLLDVMRQRDPAKFTEVFGREADALLQITNATGGSSAGPADGRSPRLQKVAGSDLWEEPWLTRFREAGCHKPFQSVQNQVAATLFLDPMLRFAQWMGLNTERALAILVDRAADLGIAPAQEWVANSAGPLQTAPQRHPALAALGFDSIRAFQNAHPGTETNGQWGPLTHAAAVAALRDHGASPVPLPTTDQMLDALVRRSARTPGFHRIRALRNDARFADTPFRLGQERQ